MRFLTCVPGPLLALAVAAVPGWAADYALIYEKSGTGIFANSLGEGAAGFDDPLQQAGFDILQPADRSGGLMWFAAQNVQSEIASGNVDRLVIALRGPFVHSAHDTWLLPDDAEEISGLTVGGQAISLSALSEMAARAGDRAVVLIEPGPIVGKAGPGLSPGLGPYYQSDEVTYVIGPAEALAGVLQEDLLNPGKSFAEAMRNAPEDVSYAGYMSRNEGLMGRTELAPTPEAIEDGFWAAVQTIDNVEAYDAYLKTYPKGSHAAAARDRIRFLQEEPKRLAQADEEGLNLTREARRDIQRSLSLLGFDPRGIDGIFGPGSRAAITAWQRDNGYEETGYITGNQLLRLREQAKQETARLEQLARQKKIEEERRDRAYWRETGRNGDEAGLRAYLERYPDGQFADIAQLRLAEIEEARRAETEQAERDDWDAAKEADTAEAYRDFLQSYPQSGFAEAARARLTELDEESQNAAAIEQAKAQERQLAGTKVARLLIEQRLAQLGAEPGEADGKFTKETRRAIRRFQRQRDIAVTGFISQETMVRLMAGR